MKFRLILVLFSLFMIASCSKVNKESYDQLKMGMKYEEVTDILGSPDSCKEKLGTNGCIWGDSEGTYIKAKFINDTAILFTHKNLE